MENRNCHKKLEVYSKILHFLNESSNLDLEQRKNLIQNLEGDKFQKEAGEKLIAIIDNLETKSKAKLIGRLLCLFGKNVITKE